MSTTTNNAKDIPTVYTNNTAKKRLIICLVANLRYKYGVAPLFKQLQYNPINSYKLQYPTNLGKLRNVLFQNVFLYLLYYVHSLCPLNIDANMHTQRVPNAKDRETVFELASSLP